MHPDLIAEFTLAYEAEFRHLTSSIKQDRSKTERDLVKVNKQIGTIIEAITDGMYHPSLKIKMDELEARKTELEVQLPNTEDG
ncbi:hypothetical protein [Falsihalocynthiibacter sp. CO-5D18]|uniref:hypothetical protein n=1 Tax=Falsihalocynthiibacter sp. CO-5D18 TaxID=3240872 RepID=UPI00350EF650